ncbi:diguanylate cyclase [Alteromonas sp. 5E99-2]|uniref:sensor domain-containing diguanylate cyclase n=1 Tax=Alteromonas sp. 5E99-2 TaxID=2817683 RepID=UPI001A994A6C|nr:sensor domain-containing diguanylate cyclase [Alteromonas sp. 5E99-2]MBO1256977.1 diguanylate cyclase [Alteromonas sp. 5E99-2]
MSKVLFFNRLYVRISTVICLISMLISSLASYFSYQANLAKEQKENVALVYQLADSLKRTAAIAAYVGDENLANEITKGFAATNLVSSASISSPPDMYISNGTFERSGSPVSITLLNPFNETETIGILKIYPDAEFIKQRAIYTARLNVFLLMGLSLVIAIFVSVFIYSLLTRHVRALTDSVDGVDTKSHNAMQAIDINYKKNDELGKLLFGINRLINTLKSNLVEEQTLRERTEALEKRFRLIFEQASAGIAVIDSENRIYAHNTAFEQLVPFDSKTTVSITELFLNAEEVKRVIDEIKDGHCDDQQSKDMAVIRDGELRFIHCLFATIEDERNEEREIGKEQLIQLIVYDITDRMRRERKTRFEADHDALTQLKNRRAGESGLKTLYQEALAANRSFVLMMIDLDKFKPVNDTYGHDVGDEVLKAVASCIRHYFDEQSDICVRWGGDEFMVGFSDAEYQKEDVEGLATNLLQDLNTPITLENGIVCSVGASIGIVSSLNDGANFDELLLRADESMYFAKNNGRNQVFFYSRINEEPS